MKKLIIVLFPICVLIVLLTEQGCRKDPEILIEEEHVPSDISQFIWKGMNDYYYWNTEVENLADSFPQNTQLWYGFLNSFNSYFEALFNNLLYFKGITDRRSTLIEDYEELERSYSGASLSAGFYFHLLKFPDSNRLVGYICYVLPGSPAEKAQLKRGHIFTEVNYNEITLDNYIKLLFEYNSYFLTLATFDGVKFINSTGYYHLEKEEIVENPVFMAEVKDIGDGLKTGYLIYNSFNPDFDFYLNEVFGMFKAENIDRLILDLRYNSGGSFRSAKHLASMIYSTDESKIFAKFFYNDKLTDAFLDLYGEEYFCERFTPLLDTTTYDHNPELPAINCLGLNDLYVITTHTTSSASEVLINGLIPYMNVIQVGEYTDGDNVGTVLIKDYYTTGDLNPNHKYALNPVVCKISNSTDVIDIYPGLSPYIFKDERFTSMGVLGSSTEPLFKAAVSYILGKDSVPDKTEVAHFSQYQLVADSRDKIPKSKGLYIDSERFAKY